MAVSKEFTAYIEQQLGRVLNDDIKLRHVSGVSGGSINYAYCLHTNRGNYMMKCNSHSLYPQMFVLEAEGLCVISNTQTVAVPQVVLQSHFENESFIIMEWIETARATPVAFKQFGRQLAAMHTQTALQFGLHTNNYMGSLLQSNRKTDSWAGFYTTERLQPMVKIAADLHLLTSRDVKNFEKLYQSLSGIFTEEQPALIHGDLWGGNYLINKENKPYLIDPAISYGNREFDIAMTTLFGGFNREFNEAYNEALPLAKDWQQRINLWNLYPLLLHLNLFGSGYLARVRDGLKQYI